MLFFTLSAIFGKRIQTEKKPRDEGRLKFLKNQKDEGDRRFWGEIQNKEDKCGPIRDKEPLYMNFDGSRGRLEYLIIVLTLTATKTTQPIRFAHAYLLVLNPNPTPISFQSVLSCLLLHLVYF
ncbi:hypothetical protein QVD17_11222 [Tagetes erecta]|uniref:Uncharacterized protein n=1 Tax=Tagetes erecta TaxID=13708 RepID=A0AAD8KWW8_TARER|nr:hypothetical protein QVD17_11222 [Tagetes erecta]